MGITVSQALRTEGLRDSRVVAGKAGLARHISTVTVMEVPDIAQWLSGQELVLTSLYALRERPDLRHSLVADLEAKGCAGLVVKTGNYLATVPAELIAAADQLGFPLIEIPVHVRYTDVITPVMESVLAEQSRILRHSDAVHRSLTQSVLAGGGMAAVCTLVGDYAGCRVALLDAGLRCVSAGADVSPERVGNWAESYDTLSGTWARSDSMFVPITGPDGLPGLIVPVRVDREPQGYLVLWPMSLPLVNDVQVVLEHAATVSALELLKQEAVRQVERRYRDEVLADLLQGRIKTEPDLTQRTRHMEWDVRGRYRVMLVDLSGLGRNEGARKAAADAAARTFRGMKPRPILGQLHTVLVVLLPPMRLEQDLEGLARSVQFQVAQLAGGVRPSVGFSEHIAPLLELARPFEEARDALELGQRTAGPGSIAYFERLGVYRLLKHCPPALREEFVNTVLGPVLEHDQHKGGVLLETLESYFALKGQAKAVADRLFVHVNTVKYRLHQIEELTGHAPETPEGSLQLLLALKLRSLGTQP